MALTLGVACDKPAEKVDAKTDKGGADAKADKGGADAKAEGADAKAEGADAKADGTDDTQGLGGVVREISGDTKAPTVRGGDSKPYDTSHDAGGLIGHVASGLSHDEELAASKARAELVILAGEKEQSTSDTVLCEHVWTEVFAKAYADKTARKDAFDVACKHEIEKERVKLGVEIFAQHAACVLAAKDQPALDSCDALEQMAEDELHANPHGDQPDAKLCVAAVEHLFILVSRDMVSDPDLLEILEEDIESIKEDAKLACRDEGTKAELECVMKAAVLKDLESCIVAPS